MIRDEIVNLIVAITKMIEARTTHVEVNTEYDRVRMIDFRNHGCRGIVDSIHSRLLGIFDFRNLGRLSIFDFRNSGRLGIFDFRNL